MPGDAWREPAVRLASTVGGLWLDALKMTVVPLIVALLITGIVGGADAARAGGVAGRSFAWFVAVLTGSAIFGAVMMIALLNLFPLPAEAATALRAGPGRGRRQCRRLVGPHARRLHQGGDPDQSHRRRRQ